VDPIELKALITKLTAELVTAQAAYKEKPEADEAAKVIELQSKISDAQTQLADALEKNVDPLSVDIEKRLAQARKEEKEKLYERLKEVQFEKDKAAADLKAATESLDTLKAEQAEAAKKLEDQNTNNNNADALSSEKVQELVATAIEKQQAVAEQQIAAAKAEADQQVKALQAQLTKAEVDAHRMNVLKENGDKIIPELVTGNTIEEINTSVLVARQAYERIFKTASTASAEAEAQVRDSVPSTPSRTLTLNDQGSDLTAEQIRNMSPAQWQEHRAKLGFK
jgi:DNA repair exonuclease SbcCD ATPase subunit